MAKCGIELSECSSSDPSEAKAVPLFVNLRKIRIWTAFGGIENNSVQSNQNPAFCQADVSRCFYFSSFNLSDFNRRFSKSPIILSAQKLA